MVRASTRRLSPYSIVPCHNEEEGITFTKSHSATHAVFGTLTFGKLSIAL